MSIQKTAWGHIEWLTGGARQRMSVGIVTIRPCTREEPHIHYENEQFIYILKGRGTDIIDGKAIPFHEGMFYYMAPNITHELINESDQEIRHLLVSVSTAFQEVPVPVVAEDIEIESGAGNLYSAVEAIRCQVMDNASLPVAIFDDMGNLVLQNRKYPTYCLSHCSIYETPGQCPCFQDRYGDADMDGSAGTTCPYGLTVFCTKIVYRNRFLGSLYSGHILLGNQAADTGVYDTPKATVLAIQQWMSNVAGSIVSFCNFDAIRRSISQKDSLIAQRQQDKQLLQADLEVMRKTVTNLRINYHFLFNTLNAIAGQSLEGDRATTYQTIVDLAKMFRYSTAFDLQLVPLRAELEYLNTYVHMQKLRYQEALTTEIDCDPSALDALVPFNFLQPIVENAFTHGFANMSEQKELSVHITRTNDLLQFVIANNGDLIDEVTLARIHRSIESDTGHGLSLVYAKLQASYGDAFSMEMTSGPGEKTRFTIRLPYPKQKETDR